MRDAAPAPRLIAALVAPLVLLLMALGAGDAAASHGADPVGGAPVVWPHQETLQPSTEPTEVEYHEIAITDDGLEPPIIAVPQGASVRWTNKTELIHNSTHLPDVGLPVEWNSGDIEPNGGQFVHVFEIVGSYRYMDATRADDERYIGAIVVTSNEPTTTPISPTEGPSPTPQTPTDQPTATATLPPTPTRVPPTRAPETRVGWLEKHAVADCQEIDALVRDCSQPGVFTYLRTDGIVDQSLFGREVRVEGVIQKCDGSEDEYLWLSSVAPAPGICQQPTQTPTSTPPPTPTAPFSQEDNLALNRPVTAKSPTLAGFEPSHVTDGDLGSSWYHSAQQAWLYIDMGEPDPRNPKPYNQLRLRWGYPYAERYGIYVWEDGAWRGKFLADNNSGGDDVRNLAFLESRYLMVYLMRSSRPSGGFTLSEVEVYGDERPNWALGQPVVVSSEEDGYIGANATDGYAGTNWMSQRGDANPWIAIYLPESVTLTRFQLFWTTAYPRNYSLVFFEQGRQTMYTSDIRQPSAGLHEFYGAPVSADTVMIYTNENDPTGRIALGEIRIFGPGPGEEYEAPPPGIIPLELIDSRYSWASPSRDVSGLPIAVRRFPGASVSARTGAMDSLVSRGSSVAERMPPPPQDVPAP
ncbi:MAG: discoidin domain-containing protein [Anaerolineae bacterium]